MKFSTLLIVLAFAVASNTLLADASGVDGDTFADRWSSGGSRASYSYGGKTYNRGGYIARPSRGAIERANRAGALTRSEYSRLRSEFRDVDEDTFVDRGGNWYLGYKVAQINNSAASNNKKWNSCCSL